MTVRVTTFDYESNLEIVGTLPCAASFLASVRFLIEGNFESPTFSVVDDPPFRESDDAEFVPDSLLVLGLVPEILRLLKAVSS